VNDDADIAASNDARALQSTLTSLGINTTVGVTGETLVVYTPNRYQHRRAMGAIGETFNGRRVRVFRAGRFTPATKVTP